MTRYDGKTTRRRIKKLRITETSTVDQPAQGPALIAITKRAAQPTIKNRMALTTQNGGHAHSITLVRAGDSGLAELRSGQTSYVEDDQGRGHYHDWLMDDAGNIILADAHGHSHGLSVLVKSAADLPPELAALAGEPPTGDNHELPAAEDPGTSSPEDNMTKKNDQTVEIPEAVQAQLDELTKSNERLTKSNERLAKVVALSPAQREHFEKLQGDEAEAFLAAEDKDAVLKNAADNDPIVYTTLSGREIRKSAGDEVIEMAKELDAEKRENAANRAVVKRERLVKRAAAELGHLTGADEAKADLLDAVEALPTEKQEAALAILKAQDAGMAKAFEAIGTADAGTGTGNPKADADHKVQAIAKRFREADSTLTPEQAYVKALETPEGRELHAQLIG